MVAKPSNAVTTPIPHFYRGTEVPLREIRRFARQVAKRFHPEKIILFGSHAYGSPHADSDVDILVVMPCRNQLDQAYQIHSTLLPPFPLDIIVRSPQTLNSRLAEGDSFLRDITSKGRILFAKCEVWPGVKVVDGGNKHR